MKKKIEKRCSACGTSQVNHKLMFFLRLVDEIVGRIGRIYEPFFSMDDSAKLADLVEKFLLNSFHFLRLVRYDNEIEKSLNGRSRLIWEEARRRNIKMEQLFFLGRPIDHYRAKINGKFYFFQSVPVPPWLSRNGYAWVDDKFIFAKKLKTADLPSPETKKILFLKDALKAFDNLKKPIIIKPQFGSLGRHTTTNINTKEEMEKAFKLARQITLSMVAQEHLFGSVYRATVVNGNLVGFFRADPPYILGDGIKNIKELISEKNKSHKERVSEVIVTEELVNFLARQNLTVDSVLPVGKKVNLLAKTGRLYGGYTKEMLPEVHPKMYDIFSKAAKLVSIPVAGFDLIIEDPAKDPDIQHWGIIECNSLPFIDLHFFALEGKPVNIAKYIWDLWD